MPAKTKPKEKSKANSDPSGGRHEGNPIVWAEIPVGDMNRAKTFYGNTFGFTFQMQDMGDYQLAMFPSAGTDFYGAGGALMKGESYVPSHEGPAVYIASPDIEATLRKVVQNGGRVIQHKKSIGPYGFIGVFEDSEGNRVALHSMA